MKQAQRILIPLPSYGFDPTESAVPWRVLKNAGFEIRFATPDGSKAQADVRMVTGVDLPMILRRTLMANAVALDAYHAMCASEEFQSPLKYDDIQVHTFVGLLLPGGHDKGMRPYLESSTLQECISLFFRQNTPVAAICHGVLLAARSKSLDPAQSGKSVLWGKKTTGLTKNQEMAAYYLTKIWLADYYRTYRTPMADEVISYLQNPTDFLNGPEKFIPMQRDSNSNPKIGFTVCDGNYISARWPGDAHAFALNFVNLLRSN